jgi:sortase A
VSLRGVLRSLSTVLIVAGALLIVDVGVTLVWQEPLTALSTKVEQAQLGDDLAKLRAQLPSPLELQALSGLTSTRKRVAFSARSLDRKRKDGEAVGRIVIPKLGASFVIVKGTDGADLQKGPGLYDDTPFPGAPGTTAIAGHRTTYLAPFRHVDQLKPGNTIRLEMPYATLTYIVQKTKIVAPTDFSVIRRESYDRLVLTACHPLFSAAQRIVIFARLARTDPIGATKA